LNFYFLLILALAAIVVWTVGAFSFWQIGKRKKVLDSALPVQPAFRLADQWILECQQKIEKLFEASEQLLGTAQHELLDLRLEAGRLPQGIKNLKLVRESLAASFKPASLEKSLPDIMRIYLDEADFQSVEASLVSWKTPLGEMPCLEMESRGTLSDVRMKTALARLNQSLNQKPAAGGFLYFPSTDQYQACLQNSGWMEGLKSRQLMVLDFRGLTALLASLRLAKDTEKMIKIFQEGVESTQTLVGQADKMGEALSRLSGDTLKLRTVMDGHSPESLKSQP